MDACLTCRARLSAYLDRQLPPPEAGEVEAHLSTCAACRKLAGELASAGGELERGLARLYEAAPPAGDLLAGIQARLATSVAAAPPPHHELAHGGAALPQLPASTGLFATQTRGEFLARFARTLSVLLAAGRPPARALELVAVGGEAGDDIAVCRQLAEDVRMGHPLSEAMARRPDVFPEYLCATVRAGEASGRLPQVLDRAAAILEMRQESRQRITSNLSYPAMVLAAMLLVCGYGGLVVVPRVARVYANHNAALPPLTSALLSIVQLFSGKPLIWLTALVGTVTIAVIVIRSGQLYGFFDTLRLRLPVLRAVSAQYLVGWYASVTSVLIEGGVPVARALALAADASESRAWARHVRVVVQQVESGVSLAAALATSPAFPADARQILTAGEEANALQEAFATVSRLYHERLGTELKLFAAFAEPIAVLALGLVVATYCMAVYAPLAGLASVVAR